MAKMRKKVKNYIYLYLFIFIDGAKNTTYPILTFIAFPSTPF